MTSNNIKFLTYATAVLLAVVFVVASFSSNNIKFGTNLLRGRASEEINSNNVTYIYKSCLTIE